MNLEELKNIIDPKKEADKQFFLDLLDADVQRQYETAHIKAVLSMLKIIYINKLKKRMDDLKAEKEAIKNSGDYNAEKYRQCLQIDADMTELQTKIDSYKPFFEEPYFARMDVEDNIEGYNSYYIGKHGDEGLEIVDWRAPLARRYYQKSKLSFAINQYVYKVILRRALRTKNGKVLDFQNEYLSVKDYLSPEEIDGRDEAVIFDPFLKEILKSRKEKEEICDIIETIQEKQYEIITLPEQDEFAVQGVAGAGKTMILLHRLSYLMYNNEKLRPENILVITPSDSFNAFIDELSAILELEKVRTSTLSNYYIRLLQGQGIEVGNRINHHQDIPRDYLNYIYSYKFAEDVEKVLSKVYDCIYGMVSGDVCKDFSSIVERACETQEEEFDRIKNTSIRVRRCMLGEIKEKKDGGLYYTKPLRYLFNAVSDIREFLHIAETNEKMRNYSYFFRQTMSFGKSIKFVQKKCMKICEQTEEDLVALSKVIVREIADLKRYHTQEGDLTYEERIKRRQEIQAEIKDMLSRMEHIKNLFASVCDYAEVLRGDEYFNAMTRCENIHDLALFFFRETVGKSKLAYDITDKKLNVTDPFAICLILAKMGCNLTPKYSFLFIDEAQDLSPVEYDVLKMVNDNAKFNVFGDLEQNITPWRAVGNWDILGFKTYTLNRNYRNTNQIVNYVSENLGVDMKPIGFDGDDVVRITLGNIGRFLGNKKGLRAIICSENRLEDFAKKSYNLLRVTGRISKSKVNVMTVYESKGLEFTAVVVADKDLTENEKYIAYTRALRDLAVTD